MYPSADDGLSEVVGFICILALIAVVFSIWTAWGVPADELQKERDTTAAAAVQFSDMKLAMDYTVDCGRSRYHSIGDDRCRDSGYRSLGCRDPCVRQ